MTRRVLWALGVCGVVVALLAVSPTAHAEEETLPKHFKYAGGTENLSADCEGTLELSLDVLTFRCRGSSVEIPYSSITLMQYRSNISKKIRKMKVKWKIQPDVVSPIFGAKKNRYFTVVFRVKQKPHIMVLRVEPDAMRPYLAELDLRVEQRVEVQSYDF